MFLFCVAKSKKAREKFVRDQKDDVEKVKKFNTK
jgi:hypothetical protein